MPASLVEQDDGVGVGSNGGRDFGEMQAHRFGIAMGQDEGSALALAGADRAEQIGRSGALVVWCRGTAAAPRPASSDAVLLAHSGFVLEPDLYALAGSDALRDLRQRGGEFFLNVSKVAGSCA